MQMFQRDISLTESKTIIPKKFRQLKTIENTFPILYLEILTRSDKFQR